MRELGPGDVVAAPSSFARDGTLDPYKATSSKWVGRADRGPGAGRRAHGKINHVALHDDVVVAGRRRVERWAAAGESTHAAKVPGAAWIFTLACRSVAPSGPHLYGLVLAAR